MSCVVLYPPTQPLTYLITVIDPGSLFALPTGKPPCPLCPHGSLALPLISEHGHYHGQLHREGLCWKCKWEQCWKCQRAGGKRECCRVSRWLFPNAKATDCWWKCQIANSRVLGCISKIKLSQQPPDNGSTAKMKCHFHKTEWQFLGHRQSSLQWFRHRQFLCLCRKWINLFWLPSVLRKWKRNLNL